MKTIYLIRHAEPQRYVDVPQEEWPLSSKGHEMAAMLMARQNLKAASCIYSSPFTRAMQTARYADVLLTVDARLQERRPGRELTEAGDCWLKQYEDRNFKCPDGESFNEVEQRMNAAVEEILAGLAEGEKAIVVTHAAATCAYLLRYCSIHVTERASKTREIIWQGKTVYTGSFPPLTGFVLSFCQGKLTGIDVL